MNQDAPVFGGLEDDQLGTPLSENESLTAWIVFAVLLVALIYGYLNMLALTSHYWWDDLYSHGWLVPAFACVLFYLRFQPLTKPLIADRWIGLGVIVASLAMRLAGSYYVSNPVDRLSFIGCLLGLTLLVGGRRMFYWAGPALGFVIFMFPLPAVLEHSVLLFLQRVATVCSTIVLQTLGVSALQDGNRIMIDQLPLEVADACSGLRMVTIFGAMSVAMALLINRPWWDRLIILLSAIPIALLTNIIRITLTALLYKTFGMENELIDHLIHDWAGLAMMPIALGLLGLELKILSMLTVPIETDEYASLGAVQG